MTISKEFLKNYSHRIPKEFPKNSLRIILREFPKNFQRITKKIHKKSKKSKLIPQKIPKKSPKNPKIFPKNSKILKISNSLHRTWRLKTLSGLFTHQGWWTMAKNPNLTKLRDMRYLKKLPSYEISAFNPIPTRYFHSDKSYPCLVGIGLSN